MSDLSASNVRYSRLDRAQFEGLVRGYEGFLAGHGSAGMVSARFLIARDMACEGRTLHDINFTGSDLSGSRFKGSDLRRASFYGANLSQCDFRKARLERADLRGCTLAGANFDGAVLDEADMRAAVLLHTDEIHGLRELAGSRLNRSSLDDGSFAVDFTNCSLRGARMKNANLKNANFSGANLDGADLAGARLGGAKFDGAILTGVDTGRLGLPRATFANCVLEPSALALAALPRLREQIEFNHAWVTSGGAAGRPAVLDGMDLRPGSELFRNRLLIGFSAKGAMAVGVDFTDCELAGANFDGADLRSAIFRGADLRGASFRNAKLHHAVLHQARIEALPLAGGGSQPTRFDDASLEGCRLAPDEPLPAPRRA